MSDRRADQGTPLFPRRTLSGPPPVASDAPQRSETPKTSEASETSETAKADERRHGSRDPGRGWLRRRREPGEAREAGAREAGVREAGAREAGVRETDDDGGPPTVGMSRVDRVGTDDDSEAAGRAQPRAATTGPRPGAATAPTGRRRQPQPTRAHPAPPTPAQGSGGRSSAADETRTHAVLSGRQRPRQPRKARLRIVRLDPWSVMKMAFALSIALAIVTVVAVAIVWSVLDAAGVWEAINTSIDTITNSRAGDTFDVQEYVGFPRVMGLTLMVSVANVVLLTALATLGAFLYNLAAALLGGFEITLAEDR